MPAKKSASCMKGSKWDCNGAIPLFVYLLMKDNLNWFESNGIVRISQLCSLRYSLIICHEMQSCSSGHSVHVASFGHLSRMTVLMSRKYKRCRFCSSSLPITPLCLLSSISQVRTSTLKVWRLSYTNPITCKPVSISIFVHFISRCFPVVIS